MTIHQTTLRRIDGLLRCSRYAFGPNRLHYCGPDANREIASYIEAGATDAGLASLLAAFGTMYPYLRYIAQANNIKDPFDESVVEAYWLGNGLLETVSKQSFYRHLFEDHGMRSRAGARTKEYLGQKISLGAVPHHSFHVLNIWKRTGHAEQDHTLESMDSCIVSSGKIVEIAGARIVVETEPLSYAEGKLFLGTPVRKTLTRMLDAPEDISALAVGDIVTMHWGVPCEVITLFQQMELKKYTLLSVALANKTL